jgi:hypothetical protein
MRLLLPLKIARHFSSRLPLKIARHFSSRLEMEAYKVKRYVMELHWYNGRNLGSIESCTIHGPLKNGNAIYRSGQT